MAAPANEPDEASPPSPDYLDALLTKPARSGRTGQRPFGSLGDQIEARRKKVLCLRCELLLEVDKYDEQLANKVEDLKAPYEIRTEASSAHVVCKRHETRLAQWPLALWQALFRGAIPRDVVDWARAC